MRSGKTRNVTFEGDLRPVSEVSAAARTGQGFAGNALDAYADKTVSTGATLYGKVCLPSYLLNRKRIGPGRRIIPPSLRRDSSVRR